MSLLGRRFYEYAVQSERLFDGVDLGGFELNYVQLPQPDGRESVNFHPIRKGVHAEPEIGVQYARGPLYSEGFVDCIGFVYRNQHPLTDPQIQDTLPGIIHYPYRSVMGHINAKLIHKYDGQMTSFKYILSEELNHFYTELEGLPTSMLIMGNSSELCHALEADSPSEEPNFLLVNRLRNLAQRSEKTTVNLLVFPHDDPSWWHSLYAKRNGELVMSATIPTAQELNEHTRHYRSVGDSWELV